MEAFGNKEKHVFNLFKFIVFLEQMMLGAFTTLFGVFTAPFERICANSRQIHASVR